jgi:hypothetical protein
VIPEVAHRGVSPIISPQNGPSLLTVNKRAPQTNGGFGRDLEYAKGYIGHIRVFGLGPLRCFRDTPVNVRGEHGGR